MKRQRVDLAQFLLVFFRDGGRIEQRVEVGEGIVKTGAGRSRRRRESAVLRSDERNRLGGKSVLHERTQSGDIQWTQSQPEYWQHPCHPHICLFCKGSKRIQCWVGKENKKGEEGSSDAFV